MDVSFLRRVAWRAVSFFLATVVAVPAAAVDTTWTFNGDGLWTDASNWDNGEPVDDTFDVFIDDGDTAVNVTLNTSRTIGSLSLGSDDTLTVENGPLTSANGFANDGSLLLTTTINTTAELTVTNGTLTNNATGLVHFQAGIGGRTFNGDLANDGSVTIDDTTTFNKSGGSYTNNAQFTINSGGGSSLTISGGGTFEQAGGTLDVTGTLNLNEASTLNMTGGMLDLTGNLSRNTSTTINLLTGGTLNIDGNITGGGTLTQDGGTLNYTSGQFSGDTISGGTYRYLGGEITGTPRLSGATLEIGPTAIDPVEFQISQGQSTLVLANDILAAEQKLTIRPTSSGLGGARLTSAEGFTNNGTIELRGYILSAATAVARLQITDGTLVNGPTGLIDFALASSSHLRQIAGNFTNNGTVLVNAGGGALTKAGGGGLFTNNAQFTVNGQFGFSRGTFNQAGGVLDANAEMSIGIGGTLELTGGTFDLSHILTLASEDSRLSLLDGGTLNMDGSGNISGVASRGVFTQDGGTFNFTSSGSILGTTFEFLGGTINGTPRVTASTLVIGPMATDPVSFLLQSNNTLVGDVHSGQTLTVRASGRTFHSASGFTNAGSMLLMADNTGTTTFAITDGTLTNSNTGQLHFQAGPGNHTFSGDLVNDGTVIVDQPTSFTKLDGSYTNNNQFTINSTFTITNDGTLTNSATGVISGAGTVNSTLDNAGTVRATGGTLNLTDGPATNTGVFEAVGDSTLNVTAPLSNLDAGTLTSGTYRSVSPAGTAAVTIAGTAVETLAAGTTAELSGDGVTMSFDGTALAGSLTDNAGTLNLFDGHHFNMTNALANSGTVHLGGGGLGGMLSTSSLANTGTLAGNGIVSGEVTNTSGTVAPGNSPGQITVDGDYTQGAAGELAIELLSQGNFDLLDVTGAATLDGILSVSLLSGFSPGQDNTWTILTAGQVVGTFSDPQLPQLTADLAWELLYEATSVSLVAYLPGDYNRDGVVNAADYVVWRNTEGDSLARGSGADGDFDGQVTPADYAVWQANFGGTAFGSGGVSSTDAASRVPEPAAGVLCWLVAAVCGWRRGWGGDVVWR